MFRAWLLVIVAFGGVSGAEGQTERITLMLGGPDCRKAVAEAMKQIPEVKAVDVRSIPGHALVDIEAGALTADQLSDAVRRTGVGSCRVEPMQGCITPP